jgi:signal transduction histidine kinase
MKTQLLSTVSHELRTPLAVIKAHIGLLRNYYDRLPKERHLEYLNTVNQETDRLAQMIDDLLNMSRIESGRLEIRKERIEPLPLLKHLADLLEKRFADRKFTWSIPETLLPVSGDSERVRQVITNLVDNAVKYSPAGTELQVGARAWEDGLEIWVKDNGNGLTPDQIRRVFDRFFQVEDNNKNPRSGVGLGLAICKALVEEMGGRIWVESTGLNQGSRFAFTLPWYGIER